MKRMLKHHLSLIVERYSYINAAMESRWADFSGIRLAASRRSFIRRLAGDLGAGVEGRIFGRAGEALFEAIRFAAAFDTVFDGLGRSCLVGELLADAQSPEQLVGVVGVLGLRRTVS